MTDTIIALFIDADNVPAKKIGFIISELAIYGRVIVRNIYGDWNCSRLKSWKEVLQTYRLKPIQQKSYTKGKNATDMAMTIGVMDTLHAHKEVKLYCIVSSDSDFTPLVNRIKKEGKHVIGFGEHKTPKSLTDACSKFVFLDKKTAVNEKIAIPKSEIKTTQPLIEKPQSAKKKVLAIDTSVINRFKNAVKKCADDDGWANLGSIGQHVNNQNPFDCKAYGYEKLSDLVKAINALETKNLKNNSQLYVRDKQFVKSVEKTPPTQTQKKTGKALKYDTQLMNWLRTAVDMHKDQEGWASISPIGSYLNSQTGFKQSNYGYKKLSDLIKAIDLFEIKMLNRNQMYVKHKG